jgi:transcriptional regulator with XRE-family HTH domain
MTENSINSIGERIRYLRKKRKISIREVSEKTGIDSSLLGRIERNNRQPTQEQIKQLSIFYNLDENLLKIESLSDQLAYQVIIANVDIKVFRVAEKKIEYLKNKNKNS